MPIYEYSCSNCKKYLNKLQKINEEEIKHCPFCKKMTLNKKISGGGFILKGSGWYVTDFKNKANTVEQKNTPKPKTDTSKTTANSGLDKKPAEPSKTSELAQK